MSTILADEGGKGGLVICRPSKVLGTSFVKLLQSDIHIGSVNTDYALIEEELKEAKEMKARISVNGDMFENLFHTNQKQFAPHQVHKRLRGVSDQVKKAIEWALEIYGPYASQIDMIGAGNHCERAVKQGHFDMVAEFVRRLNELTDHTVHYGGYSGFIDYRFERSSSRRFVIYYHHGWGSGSGLASAASDFSRACSFENVDVVWLGHKHARMNAHIVRPSCPKDGYKTKIREVRFIRTGAYMDSFGAQDQESLLREGRLGNYAADAGLQGHGKGGAWLNVSLVPKFKVSVTQ